MQSNDEMIRETIAAIDSLMEQVRELMTEYGPGAREEEPTGKADSGGERRTGQRPGDSLEEQRETVAAFLKANGEDPKRAWEMTSDEIAEFVDTVSRGIALADEAGGDLDSLEREVKRSSPHFDWRRQLNAEREELGRSLAKAQGAGALKSGVPSANPADRRRTLAALKSMMAESGVADDPDGIHGKPQTKHSPGSVAANRQSQAQEARKSLRSAMFGVFTSK
jgi:hypothetical protein